MSIKRRLFVFFAILTLLVIFNTNIIAADSNSSDTNNADASNASGSDLKPSVYDHETIKNLIAEEFKDKNIASIESVKNLITGELKDKRISWSRGIEISILLITATIFLVSLLNIFTMYKITQNFKEKLDKTTKEYDNKIKEYDKIVGDKVKIEIMKRLSPKIQELQEYAENEINEHLKKDFTKPFEERYLKMEYVYNQFWNNISSLRKKLSGNNIEGFNDLWDKLFKTRLALREMLSGDDGDVFTGLGTLKSMINNDKEKAFPKDSLWDLIILLKKQKRLSPNNLNLARNLGKDIGKKF